MIIIRTPLRLSIAGGGTDLPKFYRKYNSNFISTTIDRYIYINLSKSFYEKFILRYSKYESVRNIYSIKHRIIREVLNRYHDINDYLEIVSIADVPSGTGLGSSGSFTVGLINALNFYNNKYMSPIDLAYNAFKIESKYLKLSCGLQDQLIASCGGIRSFKIDTKENISIEDLKISGEFIDNLNHNFLLFRIGDSRDSEKILKKQNTSKKDVNQNLLKTQELVKYFKKAILNNDMKLFSELLNEHWRIKSNRINGIVKTKHQEIYEYALNNGATGGKLVGAGADGCMLFLCDNPNLLRKKLAKFKEIKFNYTAQGSTLI